MRKIYEHTRRPEALKPFPLLQTLDFRAGEDEGRVLGMKDGDGDEGWW